MNKDIEIILEKMKTKEKGSRQYNILKNRLEKKFKKLRYYRQSRYNPTSIEVMETLESMGDESPNKLIELIKNKNIKELVKI